MTNIENKKIIAILLTYKPDNKFVKLIESLLNQTLRLDKIVIIDSDENHLYDKLDNNNILKLNMLLSNENIIKFNISKTDFDHGRTRNFAFNKINSDYVLFMTQDAVPYDEKLVENLYNSFENNNLAFVYARQIPFDDAKYTEKLVREYNYPDYDIIKNKSTIDKYGIKNYFCSNVCAMYNSKIFKEQGMFDEDLTLNEDSLYAYKTVNNGYDFMYNSNAKVYHSHNFNYIEQFNRNYLIGISQSIYKYIYNSVSNEREGAKLVKYVCINCLKNFRFLSLIDFLIEAVFRYAGFLIGKRKYKND